MADNLSNPHDAFFRHSFSRIETARQFLMQFLPADVGACLNLSLLQLTKESFVDADLRSSQSDMLFEVPAIRASEELGDGEVKEPVLIYVLFEHKSAPDRMTPFQLLRYMVRIWEHRQKQGKPIQPIVPVVLYHGIQRWTAIRSLRELVGGPGQLSVYTPDFVSHLIDLGRYNDDELTQDEMTQATLLTMKYAARDELQDRLNRVLFLLQKLRNQPGALENLRAFLKYVAICGKQMDKRKLRIQIETAFGRQGIDIMGTIAEEWVEDGRREGLEKGRVEGRVEGRAEGLRIGVQAVVELRFSEGSEALMTRLESIDSVEQLSEVLAMSRTVQSIDELLALIDRRQS